MTNQLQDDPEIFDDSTEETVRFNEYSITSYGADLDIAGLVRRLNDNEIEIPEFQRGFVWDQRRASRFVESLLLGLPVPGIFLYLEIESEILQVIDGQQRLRTLQSFFAGEASFQNRRKRVFDLRGLETKFNGQTYSDLDDKYRRRLGNSTLHATVMRQLVPDDDDSSRYYVFERLNTEATPLSSQEIRSAIYQGPLNDLLKELNCDESWRSLFGKEQLDSRKRDEELILRFLSLYFLGVKNYKSPMKGFLNGYMSRNRHLQMQGKDQICEAFLPTVECILARLGESAFKPEGRLNAAVLDSVMVGVAHCLRRGGASKSLLGRYKRLTGTPDFLASVSKGTSQEQNVRTRLTLAMQSFVKVD